MQLACFVARRPSSNSYMGEPVTHSIPDPVSDAVLRHKTPGPLPSHHHDADKHRDRGGHVLRMDRMPNREDLDL